MKTSSITANKLKLLATMALFGTIGLFVRGIALPSSAIALFRGAIGSAFLLAVVVFGRQKLALAAIREKILPLCLSGAAIGFNWILLFEAYRHTTVAVATVCYYLAPVFVILAAPFLFREKLTGKKVLCVLLALAGTAVISGGAEIGSMRGVLFGIGAAILYAAVMTFNKKLRGVPAYERTLVQLASATVTLLPYVLLTETPSAWAWDIRSVVLLAIVGAVHTGLAYAVYFSALGALPMQTVALYSYLDPVVALLLSALFLREPFGLSGALGALLVLGSTLWSELDGAGKGDDDAG